MSCFKCPNKLTSRLNKECIDFFWGKQMNCNPVSWKAIWKPKSTNGLGVRNLDHFNNACFAKLRWKVLCDDNNGWVNIVRMKYLQNDEFLSTNPKQNHLMAWKGILGPKDVLKSGLRWYVGDCKNILFWTHNWVFSHPLYHLIPENHRNQIQWDLKVEEFINNRRWDKKKLA